MPDTDSLKGRLINMNVLDTEVGRFGRLSRFVVCAAIALFAIGWTAATASAADPVGTQYCDGLGSGSTPGATSGMGGGTQTSGGTDCGQDVGGVQEPGSTPGSGTAPATTASAPSGGSALSGNVGTLPFTGWDLISLVAIALALCAGGVALSRLSGRSRSQN